MIDTICIAVGITFLADGLLKIQLSIDARTFGIKQWWLILAAALLTAAIGIMLVFRTVDGVRAQMVLLGSALLADGVLNLITVLTTVKIIRNQYPDKIDDDSFDDIFLD